MDYDVLAQTPDYEMDKRLAVKFYKRAVKNNFKSKQEGKNVFDNIDYISIIIPGDNTSKVDRAVRDEDKERFSIIWERYLKREDDLNNGTPIELLPTLSPAQVENLKVYKVYTVEQLAGLQESAITKITGARPLVQDAQKFLEGDSYAKRLEKEVNELKKQFASLSKENSDESINNNPKRSGRNGAGGQSSKRGGKSRPVRKKMPSASDKGGKGASLSS